MSTVGIVIPVYNRPEQIKEAVSSILAQSFSDWHLIIVDDNSTDNTLNVAQNLAVQNDKIRVIKNTIFPKGPAGARMCGVRQLKTEYCAFLDSDDQWLPMHLHQCLKVITGSGAELVVSDLRRVDTENNIIEQSKFQTDKVFLSNHCSEIEKDIYLLSSSEAALADAIKTRFTIGLHSSLLKRTLLDDHPLRMLKTGEDHFFTLELIKHRISILMLNEIHLNYIVHDNNISNATCLDYQKSLDNYKREVNILKSMVMSEICYNKKLENAAKKRISEIYYSHLGYNISYTLRNYSKAIEYYKKSISYNPMNVKAYKSLLVTYFKRYRDKK